MISGKDSKQLNNDSLKFSNLEIYRLIVQFAEFARTKGLEVKPYNPRNAFDRFLARSEKEQRDIVENFRFYFNSILALTSKGIPLRDEQQITWHFIKLMGLRPTADLFSHITDDTIVEIYTKDGVQTYRSWAFYSLCSYTIDEINSYPWWELYNREESITDQIVAQVGKVLSGEVKSSLPLTIPTHDVREIFGPNKYITTIEQKYFSPLFDRDGSIKAFVHLFKVLNNIRTSTLN